MKTLVAFATAFLHFAALSASSQSFIDVNIAAPAGVVPAVSITDSKGFNTTIDKSGRVALPAKGKYTLVGLPVRLPNDVADEAYEAAPVTVDIRKDSVYTAGVAYAKRNGSGMVWMPDMEQHLLGISHQRLLEGNATPDIVIATKTAALLSAVDTLGNLWYWDNEFLYKIPHRNIRSGSAQVEYTIELPMVAGGLFNANQMMFDRNNTLWLSMNYEMKIVGFTPATLASKGKKKPDYILNIGNNPFGFAFNKEQTLLAVGGPGGFTLYAMPTTLSASNTLQPVLQGIDLGTMPSVAFDDKGNLWATNENRGIQMFTKATLTRASVDNNHAQSNIETTDVYWGIQFDNKGNIWVCSKLDDGEIGMDCYETQGITMESLPAKSLRVKGRSEHGKFGLTLPRK